MSVKKRNVPFLKKCNFKNTLLDMYEDEPGFRSTDKYNSTIAYLARKFKSLQKIRSVMLIFSAFFSGCTSQVFPTSKGPFIRGRPSEVA